MDISHALTEPGVRLVAFHESLNRNLKVSFGALAALNESAIKENAVAVLPTGGEPWGLQTRWRSLDKPVKDAAGFLAELGIARAAAAFEDYLVGAKAEFDRSGRSENRSKSEGIQDFHGLDAIFGLDPEELQDEMLMAKFFNVARNCVVHRSNRASSELCDLRERDTLIATLARWSKRSGRWSLSLPDVHKNLVVDWQPRHAIMASDVFYRCAMKLDRKLVELMGTNGIVKMAAHWCFFADPPTPCPAKLDAGTMVRTQLVNRYLVRSASLAAVVAELRQSGSWVRAREAFKRMYPEGPETSRARRRRLRRAGARAPKSVVAR